MLTLEAAQTIRAVAGAATAVTYTIFGDEHATGDTFKVLAQGQLPSSVGTLYTVPGSTSALVKSIRLANTTGSDVTGIKFYVGGTAAANQITGTFTIPANGTASLAGDRVEILDAAGALVYAGIVPTSRQVIAGSALTGGGALTGDVTLDVGVDNSTIEVNADALRVKAAGITGSHIASGVALTSPAISGTPTGVYFPGGTDVPITDGGTGVSTLPTGILKGAGTGAITAVTAPSGAVVGTTDTQTLTNKTLTAPAISSPTGLVKGDVGLGNVDNTADTAKPVSTAQQTALDAKVAGPGSATSGNLASFSGATGKIVQDTGVAISTDGTFAANSDLKNPTEKATRTYVDTADALKEAAWTYERLAADFVRTATTLADVFTGFTPTANKSYEFEVFGAILSDAATTGFQSDFNGPTGENWVAYKINSAASATTDLLTHGVAWATLNTATNGLAGTNVFIARGLTSYGASPGAGNVRLRARCETGGGAMSVTMKAGSYMRWRQLP